MQFTGLKDIYEEDIIEGGYCSTLTQEFVSRKYVLEYTKANFMVKLIGHSPYGDIWLHFIKGYVLGNIFEKLELVEM